MSDDELAMSEDLLPFDLVSNLEGSRDHDHVFLDCLSPILDVT